MELNYFLVQLAAFILAGMKTDLENASPLKTFPVKIRPGLYLYRQPQSPGVGSPFWYVRARLDVGGQKVHVKSTGTTDLNRARCIAEDFYDDLRLIQRGGTPPLGSLTLRQAERRYRFDVVADSFLDNLERASCGDERKLQRYKDHKAIVCAPNGLNAFFRNVDVRTMTTGNIRDFLRFAEEKSRRGFLRPSTQRNVLATLRPILNFALEEGWIERAPKMPTVKMKDNPRSSFSRAELDHLQSTCRRLASDAACDDDRNRWLELDDFITFMIATFLRPSEWVDLKFGDINIVREGRTPHLQVAVVRGKTGKRMVSSMPEAIDALARCGERGRGLPTDYIFVSGRNNRDGALAWMRKAFAALLEEADLEHDALGLKRVIYSLRHTALSLRILEGDVKLILLARNAGTSVEMLDRFYASRLTPQHDLANLQSRRKPILPRTSRHIKVEPVALTTFQLTDEGQTEPGEMPALEFS